jgi:SAM-dependent methyltransferase
LTTSLIYRSAVVYEVLMRLLYGRRYTDRMRAVAAEVPEGSAVLELCCGPGTMYLRHLRPRIRDYVGLDVNPGFVRALRGRGVDARQADLSADPVLPEADVVIMQASLYHFLPHPETVVDRMVTAARDRVVISEPIRNLASSGIPLVGALGRRAADPGLGDAEHRFSEASLDRLMERYRERVVSSFLIPGGREKVYVLAGSRAPRPQHRSGTEAGS